MTGKIPRAMYQRLRPISLSLCKLLMKKNGNEAQLNTTKANGLSKDKTIATTAHAKQN